MYLKEIVDIINESEKDFFLISKNDLSKYIEFSKYYRTIQNDSNKIYISIYNNRDKDGSDHVEKRFEERKSKSNIASYMKKDIYEWPGAYKKYIDRAVDEIYNTNGLENGGYNMVIRPLGLQYLLIIGYSKSRNESIIIKNILVNTVLSNDDNLSAYVRFRGQKIDAKQMFVEHILKASDLTITKIF